jgi:hypothetical protein
MVAEITLIYCGERAKQTLPSVHTGSNQLT